MRCGRCGVSECLLARPTQTRSSAASRRPPADGSRYAPLVVEVRIGDQLIHLSWDEWEERVRDGRIPDDAAVRFPPVTGEDFRVAAELEMFTSVRSDATRAWQRAPSLRALRGGAGWQA